MTPSAHLWRDRGIAMLLIAVVALLAYSNTFTGSFQFDDFSFITKNFTIRDVVDLQSIWKGILNGPSRFVSFLTFALNYHFFGDSVVAYHVTNLIIHILSAWLVFWCAQLLIATPRMKSVVFPPQFALFVAFIFVVHPGQTQAISYITQRFESLATLWYIAAVCCYLRGRASGFAGRIGWMSVAAVAAVLGMFTKETAITLPIMIFFCESYLYEKKKISGVGRVTFIGLLAAFVFIVPALFSFQIVAMLFGRIPSASHVGDVLTLPTYLLTQLRVIATFMRLCVLPYGQTVDYDFPMSHSLFDPPTTVLSAVVIAASLFAAWQLRKKHPAVSFGIGWFFITLLANLVPRAHVIFEHKLYLAMFGFSFALCFLVGRVVTARRWYYAAMIAIVMLLALMTYQRNRVWHDEITLWRDVVTKAPNKSRAHTNLGRAYANQGDLAGALIWLNEAVRLEPRSAVAYNNRAVVLERLGQTAKAEADYTSAIQMRPGYALAYANRGAFYRRMKNFDAAFRDYDHALEYDQNQVLVYLNRGVIFKMREEYEKALADFNRAGTLSPHEPLVYTNRGLVYMQMGKTDEAIKDFTRAIQLNPQLEAGYGNRGIAYLLVGKYADAVTDFTAALTLNSQSGLTYSHRAQGFARLGKYHQALQDAYKAQLLGTPIPAEFIAMVRQKLNAP